MKLVIYVIDDHRAVAESTAKILRAKGHQVSVETDAESALAVLLSDLEIDVTFLDIVMPSMGGATIFERCKRDAPARCERIVFITGYADMVPDWVQRTGRPLIEKPAAPEQLMRAVERIGTQRTPRGPQAPMPAARPRYRSGGSFDLGDDFGDEVTGITRAALGGDPFAQRVKDWKEATDDRLSGIDKAWKSEVKEVKDRMANIEAHFENNPTTKKFGMVAEMYNNMEFIKRSVSFWPKAIAAIGGVLGVLGVVAAWWLAAHQPPPPPQVDYARMVREIQKAQRPEFTPMPSAPASMEK